MECDLTIDQKDWDEFARALQAYVNGVGAALRQLNIVLSTEGQELGKAFQAVQLAAASKPETKKGK
jgi:hypothetical protein